MGCEDDYPYWPLSRADWNFDQVPESEVTACCLWEYARESKTIGMVADRHWCGTRNSLHGSVYAKDPALKAEHDEHARSIEKRLTALKFDYAAFCERYWATEAAFIGIFDILTDHTYEGARAWQQLSAKAKSWIVSSVNKSVIYNAATLSLVGELERLWNGNRSELDEVRSRVRDENDDSEDAALYGESQPITLSDDANEPHNGSVVVALTVDFTRFTDKEITAEFVKWLRTARPEKWRNPRRIFPDSRKKGRKSIEYRVALDRLGLMRLLHWYSPEELRESEPEAWKKYGRKRADFRREVRAGAKFFQNSFSFLPAGELPKSFERKGVWVPAMNKIAEEVEAEMATRGGQ